MNRAERRRVDKASSKSDKAYMINANAINSIKAEATNNAIDKAFILMLSMPLMVLRDKYGFGRKRLTEFNEYVLDLYDSFKKDYVTLDDLSKTVEEETGVKLELRKGDK